MAVGATEVDLPLGHVVVLPEFSVPVKDKKTQG